MSEPELKIPEGWEERVPDGWEWQTLWEAVEAGDHEYTHSRVEEAIAADIDPRVILDDGLFLALIFRVTALPSKLFSSLKC